MAGPVHTVPVETSRKGPAATQPGAPPSPSPHIEAQGCRLQRHRLFECSFPVEPPKCRHDERPVIGVYGGHARRRAASAGGRGTRDVWEGGHRQAASEALGIDWATLSEMSEAIPPAYAQFIATAFLAKRPAPRPPKKSRGVRAVRNATAPLSTNCHGRVVKRSPAAARRANDPYLDGRL